MKVYLDTSIINYFFAKDAPTKRLITINLFAKLKKLSDVELCISEITAMEINQAPLKKRLCLENKIKELRPKGLKIDKKVYQLAKRYLAEGVVPQRFFDDAQHLAAATVNNVDIVLSWNFRHFVNPKVRRMVNAVNALLGYSSLDIISPEELLGMLEAEENN